MSGEKEVRLLSISIFIGWVLFFSCSSAQTLFPDREAKIKQLRDRTDIKVTEIEPGILQIQYPGGKSIFKNTNDFKLSHDNSITYSPTFDSTIIDLRTLDTIPFYQKYSFWQELNIGNRPRTAPLIFDMNNNNQPEIYGYKRGYDDPYNSNIFIMEKNDQSIFDSIYGYDSTVITGSIYDIDKDRNKELQLARITDWGLQYLFYKKPSDTSFATDISVIFEPWQNNNSQENNNRFGDWDGDEFTDQIFIRECCPHSINIFEYNPVVNNFDSVYQFDLSSLDLYYAGFAIGDFDQDGKTEFFSGSVHGNVLSIENNGDNSYYPNWQGTVETYNAYILAETNDIDGNGKPEVWIGGDAYYSGLGITRITLFENNGNNNYQVVGKIDLIGVFSFYATNIQVLDVDKDGKEEVMICIDEHVIILKFNGVPNHQIYSVYYIKRNDLLASGRNSEFYGATMYNVTDDDKDDIVIDMDEAINIPPWYPIRVFTFIYKSNLSSRTINDSSSPAIFNLYQNYPNPFNPVTRINFEISEYSTVTLQIYNCLGKEITTLLNKELSPGSFTVDWEARDSNDSLLPSGIYLIRLYAVNKKGSYTNTIKTVLVK